MPSAEQNKSTMVPSSPNEKAALFSAFWKQAAPSGRIQRCALNIAIPEAEDGTDTIDRDEFLAWLFEKRVGTPSLLSCSLKARASTLLILAEQAPAPSAELVCPGAQPLATRADSSSEAQLFEEILVQFGASPAPAARDARHFLNVIEAGMDPNNVVFPRMELRGKVLPRPPSRGKCGAQDPNDTPFPMPFVCSDASHTCAPLDTDLWSVGSEAETGEKWLAGLARSVEELRSAMYDEPPLDMKVAPWRFAEDGVIAADKCTDAQLRLIEERAGRGPLSAQKIRDRRSVLGKTLGALNVCCFQEVRPQLERDAALLEMQARWASDKAKEAQEYDERAEYGARFVAWPQPNSRTWPPQPAAWKRHAEWFKRWRAQPRVSLEHVPLGSLRRSDSMSSVDSWLSVSDISWVEVQSEAAESSWQVVLDEATRDVERSLQDMMKNGKKCIEELKALSSPPRRVKLTMEVVCILLGVAPKKTQNGILDYWEPSKKLLSDPQFFDRLMALQVALPVDALHAVAPYMTLDDFTPEAVSKCSIACVSLCKWVRVLAKYHTGGHAVAEAARAEVAQKPAECLLAEAVAALNTLSKADITELKSLGKPPMGVDMVCICVLHLFAGIDPSIELTTSGNVRAASWKSAQKMLGDACFLNNLITFKDAIDAGKVPRKNIEKARKFKDGMGNSFSVEIMAKKSLAAAGLCAWISNIIAYYDIVASLELKPVGGQTEKVMPPLETAFAAEKPCVDKRDLQELRSLCRPPAECVDVMAVCTLLLRSETDDVDWRGAQKGLLADPVATIEAMRTFDVSAIPQHTLNKVEAIKDLPFFDYEVMKGKSLPAAKLVNWVNNVVPCRKMGKQQEAATTLN